MFRRKDDVPTPADVLSELIFSQSMSSFKSFAGIVFLVTRTIGSEASGEIGAKLFNTSYGSEYKARLSMCEDVEPSSIV